MLSDRANLISGLWVAGVAVAWLLFGWFITDLGFYATWWVPVSQGIIGWDTIASYATAGVWAFALFAALRRWAGAPRQIWIGVAVIEGVPVALFLIAVAALALGYMPPALYAFLLSKSDAGALPVADQLQVFATWWVWSSAFLVLGAWAGSLIEGSRRHRAEAEPA